MAGNTTATLDIILRDDVSANAVKIAAQLKKVEAEAKAIDSVLAKSGAGEKFSASLKNIGASATHVEAASKAWKDYASSQGLAAEKGNWTAKQTAEVRNWERVTVAGVRSVMGAERALEASRAKASVEHLRQVQVEHRAQERLVEQAKHGADHHGFKNFALQSAALAVSAHGIMSVLEKTVEAGADYQHRLVALQNAGRTPAEIEEMSKASHAALRGVPTATLTGNLEILNETVSAFGSVDHALEHLGFMAKSAAVLHAVAGDKIGESAGAMGNQLARFFEMRGTASNGKVFESEASEMMKSMVFSGGNVNPRELLNFAQMAKSSLQNYSIEFLSRVAPSLIGEVGGDRAGTQANAFNSVILGKANDAKQAAAWKKYGLINPAMMTGKGDKQTGWTGGAIYHTDEYLRNPLAAIEKYVLPALQSKGVDINSALELTKALGTMFRNVNAAAFANELANPANRARIHKDAKYIGEVEDPDTLYKRLLATDPTVAIKALTDSFGNLMTAVSSPLMAPAASAMSGIAEGMNDLAIAAANHPAAAVTAGLAAAGGALYGAGKMSYNLVNGFGLSTAAGALEGSAVALDGAAARLGVAAAEGGIAGLSGKLGAKGLTAEVLEVAATGAVSLTATSVAMIGLSAAAVLAGLRASMDPKPRASDQPGFGRAFAPAKSPFDFNSSTGLPYVAGTVGTPRGSVKSQRDTDLPGHYVTGRGGVREFVQDDLRPMRNAPFFGVAPLGADGLPTARMPAGMFPDSTDPRTFAHIAASLPAPNPDLYSPSDVPLPPSIGRAAASFQPPARPYTPTPAAPVVTPTVDPSSATDALFTLGSLSEQTGAKMQTALDIAVSPRIDSSSLDAFIAKVAQARAAAESLGSIGSVGRSLKPGAIRTASNRLFAGADRTG